LLESIWNIIYQMDKLKIENEEYLKIAYEMKSEEYKNRINYFNLEIII